MFRTFITSHCSSLPQSLYDKTHTLQKEQLVYNFIPPPSARSMLFIRTWLRAAQEHNSTDPPVFDSEEIVDLKYQDSVTNSHINEHLHCYCYCYFAGYKILLSVLMRKFHSLTEKKSKSLSVGDCEWIFVLLDLLIWVKFLDPTKIPAHILSLSLFFCDMSCFSSFTRGNWCRIGGWACRYKVLQPNLHIQHMCTKPSDYRSTNWSWWDQSGLWRGRWGEGGVCVWGQREEVYLALTRSTREQ